MRNNTRKVNKGGGFFNRFFKRRKPTNKNTPGQTVRNSQIFKKEIANAEKAGNMNKAKRLKEVEKYYDNLAEKEKENSNKLFDDILEEIYSKLSTDNYKISRRGFSNNEGKEKCDVYYIINKKNDVEYKIRKCPNNTETIEIKSTYGKWKYGPFDTKLEKILDNLGKNNNNKNKA